MVGAKGLGDEARQAKWAPQGQSRRGAQARGHSAPHVDRRNRVQLVEEGGCRVTSKRDHRAPAERREKTAPPGRWAGGERPHFFGPSNKEEWPCTFIPPPPLSPLYWEQGPPPAGKRVRGRVRG